MAQVSEHVQCLLSRGTTKMTAWIPKNIAIEGRVVDLDDPEHGPTDGWTVLYVGANPLPSDWVRERSRDYRNQRGVSDL